MIGDIACLEGPDGKPLPGLATVAIQQARHVADGIRKGGPGASTPFSTSTRARWPSSAAGKAICEVRGLKLSGRLALAMYLAVHLYYLGGAPGNRMQGARRLARRAHRQPSEHR